MTLSTHVLDISRGVPAGGIGIRFYAVDGEFRTLLTQTSTNADGRTDAPLGTDLAAGTYEIIFAAGPYFSLQKTTAFYADIAIRFMLVDGQHFHVPLLLAPWGYSTYRGS
jgi:5-hydroxyisourate hydrolase